MKWVKTYENFSKIKEEKKKETSGNLRSSSITNESPTLYLIRSIISNIKDGIEPTDEDKELLDEISEYKNLYQTTKDWLKSKFDKFKEYDFEEIEDRMESELFGYGLHPMVMFSLSKKNGSIGVKHSRLDDPKYLNEETGHILQDILYECTKPFEKEITIDEYFNNNKPALHIEFIWGDKRHTEKYNLPKLEEIADRLVHRFKTLFNVGDVEFRDFPRSNRRYDTNIDVYDYGFIIYLD